MIFYTSGGVWYLLKLFQMKGSVFPASFATAMPCGMIAAGLRWLINEGYISDLQAEDSILTQTQAWAGFSFLVGFLIVFRTSQAYSRFWDGCTSTHQMRAEWFDACSAIVSFCTHSSANQDTIMSFKHTLIRLFSMLHASALADLEDLNNTNRKDDITAFTYELIDPAGIDDESLETMRVSESRVELIFEWIQLLIVSNISTGVLSIPPPILSRAFQEIANGMVAFHDSVKISYIPFPFPYAQNCDFLLLLHWCLAPFVFTQWVTQPPWAFVMVFIQVFVLWSLNFIAVEIENPFGNDKNDLDGHYMQSEMNRHLLLLLKPSTMRLPHLSNKAVWSTDPHVEIAPKMTRNRISFIDIWSEGLSVGGTGSNGINRKESLHNIGRQRRGSATASQESCRWLDLEEKAHGNNSASVESLLSSRLSDSSDLLGEGKARQREDPQLDIGSEAVAHPPMLNGPWETLPKAPWPRDGQEPPDAKMPDIADANVAPDERPPAPADLPASSRHSSSESPVGLTGSGLRGRGESNDRRNIDCSVARGVQEEAAARGSSLGRTAQEPPPPTQPAR